jgi:hypothetical protein
MKVKDLFVIMDELKSTAGNLQGSFEHFDIFIGHYELGGEGAGDAEKKCRNIAKEEIRNHLLAIIDGTGDIITIASKLRCAAMDVEYDEYL